MITFVFNSYRVSFDMNTTNDIAWFSYQPSKYLGSKYNHNIVNNEINDRKKDITTWTPRYIVVGAGC